MAQEVSESELQSLRERGEGVRTKIQRGPRETGAGSRPLFVEFAGSPKSGKSTCIDIVSHFFKRLDYRILAPTEGASKRTPYYLKRDLVAFNTWSASYALTHIIEGQHHSDPYDIAILDRGLFDALAWFEKLQADNKISLQDKSRIHQFLLIDRWRSLIDLVFLFQADPKTSLERELRDKLITEEGMAMNETFLSSLGTAYAEVQDQYRQQFKKLHVIDTSRDKDTSSKGTAFAVTLHILDALEEHLNASSRP